MTYKSFTAQCTPGFHVTDGERNGTVIKVSQDKERVLIQFEDGSREWMEYYKIEKK